VNHIKEHSTSKLKRMSLSEKRNHGSIIDYKHHLRASIAFGTYYYHRHTGVSVPVNRDFFGRINVHDREIIKHWTSLHRQRFEQEEEQEEEQEDDDDDIDEDEDDGGIEKREKMLMKEAVLKKASQKKIVVVMMGGKQYNINR